MAQVNHSESDVMSAKKVGIFVIKADQQSAKLVDPGETAFAGKTLAVNGGIEQAFTAPPGRFAVAFILGHVGNQAMIEADFAGGTSIERTVGVEERAHNRQAQTLEVLEGRLQMGFQTKSVVVVARHDAGRGDNKALGIGDGQDIAGLGALARLVSHTITAFLGNGVAAIEVQLRQIQVMLDALDALLPHPFQTAIPAPLLKVIIHRLPTEFFFSGSSASGVIGNCAH